MGMISGIRRAFRALAKPVLRVDKEAQKRLKLLPRERDLLTRDVTRLIPQLIDVLDGLLRDTDDVLQTDPDAYDIIFDDDQIATSIDNAFLPVAQARWSFTSRSAEQAALASVLNEFVFLANGFDAMIQDALYAEICGVRIERMIWRNAGDLRDPVFLVRDFVPKDKRRFRPADENWENMYLVDAGNIPQGIAGVQLNSGFRKPLVRENYIVHRWRNTEERLGWGKGIGARLYRLAKYRRPLIHLLLQTLENSGGGIRFVETEGQAFVGRNVTEQTEFVEAVKKQLSNAISGDTIVLPPGVKANLFFPPDSVGKAIQEAVDGYIDQQIAKTISGATLQEDQAKVGSYALGKEHSKTTHRRMQFRADRLCETLDHDYVRVFALYNPWIYDRAGVPIDTPLPKLKAAVPGGDGIEERARVINMSKAPVLLSEYHEAHGTTQPTQEQIDAGETLVPSQSAPAMPGLPGDDSQGGQGKLAQLFGQRARRAPWWHVFEHRERNRAGNKPDRKPDGEFAPKGSGDQTGKHDPKANSQPAKKGEAGSPDTDAPAAKLPKSNLSSRGLQHVIGYTGQTDPDLYREAREEASAWATGNAPDSPWQEVYEDAQEIMGREGYSPRQVMRGLSVPIDHPIAQAFTSGALKLGDDFNLDGGKDLTFASWSENLLTASSWATQHTITSKGLGIILAHVPVQEDIVTSHRLHRAFYPEEAEVILRLQGPSRVRIVGIVQRSANDDYRVTIDPGLFKGNKGRAMPKREKQAKTDFALGELDGGRGVAMVRTDEDRARAEQFRKIVAEQNDLDESALDAEEQAEASK